MLASSGLLQDLQLYAFYNDKPICLYGDLAYSLRMHLQAPYRNRQLTVHMQEFNKSMSAVKILVEWVFGDIINYFKFLDFKKDL